MSNLIPWIVVGAVLAAAAALYLRLRQATELASSRQIEIEKLLGELKSTREQMERMTPMGRIGTVEDIAIAVLYLASEASSWVTGKVFEVDGGTEGTNWPF